MTEPRFNDETGKQWHPYTVEWDSPEGEFNATIWAISHEHAVLQLDALKETGRIHGRRLDSLEDAK